MLPVLVIGNKNYSSWSLRPWVLMRHHGIAFSEQRLRLDTSEFAQEVARWSPAARVPVLVHDGLSIWESLAIVEYVNEQFLEARGWPSGIAQRARARSIVAEMHAGFSAMRGELPMNVRREPRAVQLSEAARRDVERVRSIWDAQLAEHGGPWLFGAYSIADAFYAPVAFRFRAYAIPMQGKARDYLESQLSHPAMLEWAAAAGLESEVIAAEER